MQALGQASARGVKPKKRKAHAMTVLRGSSSLAVLHGGQDEDNSFLGDMHYYHARLHEWTSIKYCDETRPMGRKMHSLTSVSPSVLLVFGGLTAGEDGNAERMNDLWFFDVRNNFWNEIKAKGDAPSKRAGHTAVFGVASDGIPGLFVFGGADDSSVYRLTTLDWTWTRLSISDKSAPVPVSRELHSAVWVDSLNGMLISGGRNKSGEGVKYFNDMWLLRSAGRKKWKWTHISLSGFDGRACHTTMLLPSARPRVIIWGGLSQKGQQELCPNDFTLVDVTAKKLSVHSTRSAEAQGFKGRMLHGSVLVGDVVLVYGGIDHQGRPVAVNGVEQVRLEKKLLYHPRDDKYNSPARLGNEVIPMLPQEQPAMKTQVVGATNGVPVLATKFDGRTFMGLVRSKKEIVSDGEDAPDTPKPMELHEPMEPTSPPDATVAEALHNNLQNFVDAEAAAGNMNGINPAVMNGAARGHSTGKHHHRGAVAGPARAGKLPFADFGSATKNTAPDLRRPLQIPREMPSNSAVGEAAAKAMGPRTAMGTPGAGSSKAVANAPNPPSKDMKIGIMDAEKYNAIMQSAAMADKQLKQQRLRMQQEGIGGPNGRSNGPSPQAAKKRVTSGGFAGKLNEVTGRYSTAKKNGQVVADIDDVDKTFGSPKATYVPVQLNVQNFVHSLNKAAVNSKANKTIMVAAPPPSIDPLRQRILKAKKEAAEKRKKEATEKTQTLSSAPVSGSSSSGADANPLLFNDQPGPLKKAKIDHSMGYNAHTASPSAGAVAVSVSKTPKPEPGSRVSPNSSYGVAIVHGRVVAADAFEPAKHRQNQIDELPDYPGDSDDELERASAAKPPGPTGNAAAAAALLDPDEEDEVIVIDD